MTVDFVDVEQIGGSGQLLSQKARILGQDIGSSLLKDVNITLD
jgi:hypothetical protein